ncbi:MAG: hypothetical protein Q8P99_02350 [bacterium]|nr:hypothetical protein [bacterium]
MKKIFQKAEFKIALLVFLAVLAAYGVGYIMGSDFNRAPIIIEKASP